MAFSASWWSVMFPVLFLTPPYVNKDEKFMPPLIGLVVGARSVIYSILHTLLHSLADSLSH